MSNYGKVPKTQRFGTKEDYLRGADFDGEGVALCVGPVGPFARNEEWPERQERPDILPFDDSRGARGKPKLEVPCVVYDPRVKGWVPKVWDDDLRRVQCLTDLLADNAAGVFRVKIVERRKIPGRPVAMLVFGAKRERDATPPAAAQAFAAADWPAPKGVELGEATERAAERSQGTDNGEAFDFGDENPY